MHAPIRFKKRSRSFDLGALSIDRTSEWLVESLTEAGVEKSDRLRTRLLFEEALLNLAERFGAEQEATALLERRFGRLDLRLVVVGKRFNPLGAKSDVPRDEWEVSLFSVLEMRTHYSYSTGANVLRISLPQPSMNPVLKIGIAILVGFVAGVLTDIIVPDAYVEMVSGAVVQPIADMWVRLLQAISGPIIFLTALTAAIGTKRIADFGGSRFASIAQYFVISICVVALSIVCALPFFPLDISLTDANWQEAGSLLDGILKIVPANLFEPFITANTPQLLLIAIVTGYLLASVSSQLTELRTLIQQLNIVALIIAEQACRLVPFFVGLLLFLKIWTHDIAMLGAIWLPLVLAAVMSAIIFAVALLVVCARMRTNPFLVARKLAGPFAEALARGTLNYSSVDGLATSCKKQLGINGEFARATLPQGLVLYTPTSAVGICVFLLFAAQVQQIEVDQGWILSAAALSVVLAVATPPLTGANLLSFIVAFTYLGISADVLLDVMVFDILFGELCIAFDQAMLQLDTIWQAERMGFLDEDVLRAPVS